MADNDLYFYGANGSRHFLTITQNGDVEILEGVTMDDAARAFWDFAERFGPKKEIERLREQLAAERERANRAEAVAATYQIEGFKLCRERDTLRELLREARQWISEDDLMAADEPDTWGSLLTRIDAALAKGDE